MDTTYYADDNNFHVLSRKLLSSCGACKAIPVSQDEVDFMSNSRKTTFKNNGIFGKHVSTIPGMSQSSLVV